MSAMAAGTIVSIGSAAGGQLLVASNAARADLRLQPRTDAFLISPAPSLTASGGLVLASGALIQLERHVGAVYAMPGAGATAAIGGELLRRPRSVLDAADLARLREVRAAAAARLRPINR
jgi:hypothetical protein